MDSSILWDELEESKEFLAFSKKLERKYGIDEIGYCYGWLIRDNYNKPFINYEFEKGFGKLRHCDEDELKKDRAVLQQLLEKLLSAGKKIIVELEKENKMSNIWDSELSREENNERLERAGFANYTLAFSIKIRVEKNIEMTVEYGDLKANQKPYFSTSTTEYNENRTDILSFGQGQEGLLKAGSKVRAFYEKWNKFHCCCLTIDEYTQMYKELQELERIQILGIFK